MVRPAKDRKGGRGRAPDAGLEERLLARLHATGVALLSDEVPQRLDPTLRRDLESVTGLDLADVRIHVGEQAQRMADALGARAFAAGGRDVFLGTGQFSPGTAEGKALLAHEATHLADGVPGLSRPMRRPEVADLEGRARRAEDLVLAVEQAPKATEAEEPQAVELPAATGTTGGGAGQPRSAVVDKAALEEKIWRVLDVELRRERDRQGRA